MADMDLKDALQMFQQGTQSLMFSRALNNANDQVQQIKSSELDEQQQRAQMQQVSNQLVTHMAQYGVPATTMQMVSQALQGPKLDNANQMAVQANLTGNDQLMELAKKQQDFEFNLEDKKELARAKGINSALISQKKFEQGILDKNDTLFGKFGKDINSALASSRSPYGTWAKTENQGQRLEAIMGDSSNWSHLSLPEISLVQDGLIQQAKGGVATKEEKEAMMEGSVALSMAKAKAKLTNSPVKVDLTKYAEVYNRVLEKEKATAQRNLQKIALGIATNNLGLSKRDEKRFLSVVASQMSQEIGKQLTRDDVEILDNGTLRIKKGALDNAPKLSNALGIDSDSSSKIQIRRKMPDGKIAIFDKDKKFLRYE